MLPVVARKKGLDGHYEDANGSPQPKKIQKSVEPVRFYFILLLCMEIFKLEFDYPGSWYIWLRPLEISTTTYGHGFNTYGRVRSA